MQKFLVTVDGQFIRYSEVIGNSNPLIDFDVNNVNIVYDYSTGRIYSFRNYVARYLVKTSAFLGYVDINSFWNTAKSFKNDFVTAENNLIFFQIDQQYNQTMSDPLNFGEKPRSEKDTIILVRRYVDEFIGTNENFRIKVQVKSFPYFGRNLNENENFDTHYPNQKIEEFFIDFSTQSLSNYASFAISKKYSTDGGETLIEFSKSIKDVIHNVAILFDLLLKEKDFTDFINKEEIKLQYVFDKHFEIINDVNFYDTNREGYYNTFTPKYFELLRVRLFEFYYWAKGGGYFTVTKIKMLTWLIGLFDQFTLSQLEINDKINIITAMLKDNTWLSGRWNPFISQYKLTEEEVIVKIVESIARIDENGKLNYNEINHFLDFLNKPLIPKDSTVTVFEILYKKINDDTFFGDDGNGARGRFIKAVYLLWGNSKYNPNSEENANIAINYPYTPYNAYWQKETTTNLLSYPIDFSAAPLFINYQAEKFLLWYLDDFKFEFSDHPSAQKKIAVRQKVEGSLAPYGFYDILQPVTIRSSDYSNTIIRMPVSTVQDNPCDDGKNINNCIPIFYLKYIDDLQAISNFKQTIGTVVDVALTFTGIGNIAKLRYLTKASLVRNIIKNGALTELEQIAFRKALVTLAVGVSELSGTVSFVFNLITGDCQNYNPCTGVVPQPGDANYEKYKLCQTAQGFLFALEMLSLSGDFLARRYLQRASRDLLEHLPTSTPANHRRLIEGLADLDGLFEQFISKIKNTHPKVHDKVVNFSKKEDRFAFMFDFEGDISKLKVLEDNLVNTSIKNKLIDDWLEVPDELKYLRKDIDYLKAYNRFTQKHWEVFHITDFTNGRTPPAFHPIGAHGGKNLTNGVIRNPSLPPPAGKPATTIIESKNGHVTYKNAYFIKPDGSFKRKVKQTIWNPTWDDKRIKGEMAVAFKNKKVKKPTQVGDSLGGYSPPPQYTSVYKSALSDGTEVEFQVVNFGKDPVTNSIKTDYLIYFKLILK